mmetsp:Transcript_13743/g.21419  ORF Transcript_13743/g.21419 Transcript_13743/m.21419 type:complete len:113 (-) Transcript_13743:237-575(-)
MGGVPGWEKVIRQLVFLASRAFGRATGLLGKKHSMDVGQNATLGDGHATKQFVQLLIISDSKLEVPGDDSGLLVIPRSIACQLQDLSAQVLQHSSEINRSSSSDPSRIAPIL